ncbi:hypothetical protein JXR93_09050 [bacterium]|nr:hypothetical protein [bacterium]
MKNFFMFFLLLTISLLGNNNRYDVGEGRAQLALNFGITHLSNDDEGVTELSLLSSDFFPVEERIDIGPKLGRFQTDSNGLNFTFGISDVLNISVSSPLLALYLDDDSDDYAWVKGGTTTISLDYKITLTPNLSLIINPFLSKKIYNELEYDNGDTRDLDENSPTVDYGANFILLFEQNELFADFIFGYHRNEKKTGDTRYDEWEEEEYTETLYPEISQTTFSGYLGKLLDESTSIKAGFIFHKLKISNEGYSKSISFTKLEGVYSTKITENTKIDLALSYVNCDDIDDLDIFGLNTKITILF